MSKDTIYREDAIKLLVDRACEKPDHGASAEYLMVDEIEYYLKNLPSADRPQGEWIKHDEERDYCSRCKHIFKTRTITQQDKWTQYIDDLGYNFCPNCGSRNRKENE